MAISNYTELKTSVANWLHRSDLSSVIPDFITLAESRINRELPTRINDVDATLIAVPSSRLIALPNDFISPYALYLTTVSPRQKLTFKDNRELEIRQGTGWPYFWTINGSNIELEYEVDQPHTFTFKYRKGFALSDANPTNFLLTNNPDLYLYGALLESAPYIKDDDRVMLWQNRFDLAMMQIKTKEMESQSIATLGSDVSVIISPYGNSDIESGE